MTNIFERKKHQRKLPKKTDLEKLAELDRGMSDTRYKQSTSLEDSSKTAAHVYYINRAIWNHSW